MYANCHNCPLGVFLGYHSQFQRQNFSSFFNLATTYIPEVTLHRSKNYTIKEDSKFDYNGILTQKIRKIRTI